MPPTGFESCTEDEDFFTMAGRRASWCKNITQKNRQKIYFLMPGNLVVRLQSWENIIVWNNVNRKLFLLFIAGLWVGEGSNPFLTSFVNTDFAAAELFEWIWIEKVLRRKGWNLREQEVTYQCMPNISCFCWRSASGKCQSRYWWLPAVLSCCYQWVELAEMDRGNIDTTERVVVGGEGRCVVCSLGKSKR